GRGDSSAAWREHANRGRARRRLEREATRRAAAADGRRPQADLGLERGDEGRPTPGRRVRRRRPRPALPAAVPGLRRRARAGRQSLPRPGDVSRTRLRAIRSGANFRRRRTLMAAQQLEDQLVKHIDEALAMEQNVLRMLDGMVQTTEDEELKSELRQHKL